MFDIELYTLHEVFQELFLLHPQHLPLNHHFQNLHRFTRVIAQFFWRVKLFRMPDIVLSTLNAKFIHAAFGLRYLFANLGDLGEQTVGIEAVGLERVGHPHVKHLRGKLWEMRFSGRDGIARAIYVTAVGRRVIVVHAFVRKSQTTPKAALDLAERRAKEIEP